MLRVDPGTLRAPVPRIIGGLLFGLSRRAAAEFSFFLAVPVLFAASGYELLKHRALFSSGDLGMFGVGFAAAFVSAFLQCALAAALHQPPRLHGIRLVSDRVRARRYW